MTAHIACNPDTVCWGYLDGSAADIAEVQCGQPVRIDTVSGGESRLPVDRRRFHVLPEHLEIIKRHSPNFGPHILTGPVRIAGARPGQLLRVRIDSIELRQNWGWNEIVAGGGALPEWEDVAETLTLPIDLGARTVSLPWQVESACAPFFGILAVKPRVADGMLTSVVPSYFGGNMDVRQLRPGAEVFFPIHCVGAGFFAGDGHALQGDGEIVGTAVETALTGVFTFGLQENRPASPLPFALLPDRLLTLGFHTSLEQAADIAMHQAIRILTTDWHLDARQAYRHCSQLGHLTIAQLVNVNKTVCFCISTAGLSKRQEG